MILSGFTTPGNPQNYEDFTTYTPVDAETNYTIATNKLTITDMHTEHTEAYLYKDFGAEYFSEDFEIRFEFCVTDCEHGQDTSDMFGIIGVCNTLGVRDDWDAGPWVNWRPGVDLGTINLHCGDDSWSSSYMIFNAAPGTIFYCTLKRISAVAPLDCEVELTVYSDAERTIPMNTASGVPSVAYGEDDVPSVTGLITYKYLEVGLAERLTFDNTAYGSYYVQNVQIVSH